MKLLGLLPVAMLAFAQTGAVVADDGMPRPPYLQRAGADAQAGYELWVAKGCYLCHGRVAQGSPMSGPPLVAGAPFEYLRQFVRMPANIMPPYFPEQLSDADLQRIALYLQALPKDTQADEIPALRKLRPPGPPP